MANQNVNDKKNNSNTTSVEPPPSHLSIEQRHFIESQNECALCNGPLNIKISSYLEDYYIREEAECSQCEIKTRVKNHKMQ